MFLIHVGLVVFMTISTTENNEIPGISMTLGAGVPLPVVFTAVNGKIHAIVIKSGRFPDFLCMTFKAFGREFRREVRRIVGLVVIFFVTAKACIRCVVIFSIVTFGAAVGNGSMGTNEFIVIVMDFEGSRLPSGNCGMAILTGSFQSEFLMAGIYRPVVIRFVTCKTICWSPLVTVGMTFSATGGNMRSC